MHQGHHLARSSRGAVLALLILAVAVPLPVAGQVPPVSGPECVRWCGNQGGSDRPNPAEVREQWMEAIGQAREVEARARKEAEAAQKVAAGISLAERVDRYARAEEAVKSIRRMAQVGVNAEEYLNARILEANQKLEATDRLIHAYNLKGAK